MTDHFFLRSSQALGVPTFWVHYAVAMGAVDLFLRPLLRHLARSMVRGFCLHRPLDQSFSRRDISLFSPTESWSAKRKKRLRLPSLVLRWNFTWRACAICIPVSGSGADGKERCRNKSRDGKWCHQSTSFLLLIYVSCSFLKLAQMRVLNINGFCKSSRSVKHVIVCSPSATSAPDDRHTIYFSHKWKTQTIFTAFNEYYKIVPYLLPWEKLLARA